MKRRDFLRLVLTSAMVGAVGRPPKRLFAEEPPVLAIAEGRDYDAITRSAVDAIGGMGRFVKQNDVVVIKPNIGWDRKPEYAATTHPLVVRSLAEQCVKAGAKKVRVFDNTCNDMRRCYENSGIQEALKGMKNVEVKYIEEDRYKNVRINGVFLKEWPLYDEALTARVFINVPIAKHHGLTTLTLALKNMMGIMGGNRGYIHRGIDEALCDVNRAVKSHLVVIDATRILLNHGPQGGNLRDVRILNKVLATRDIVAADSYATTLFGLRPHQIETTVTAYRRGLGEMSLNKIKVVKV